VWRPEALRVRDRHAELINESISDQSESGQCVSEVSESAYTCLNTAAKQRRTVVQVKMQGTRVLILHVQIDERPCQLWPKIPMHWPIGSG